MEFHLQAWMQAFIAAVQGAFGPRVRFIGLQGSYARGEAHDGSDIDVVVILDALQAEDIARYRAAVAELPRRALLCGFVSGAPELLAWDRADLFQLYHDTVPYFGDLAELLPPITDADARRAVHVGACALYHGCCHNMVHAESMDTLRRQYKAARFVLQAKHFCESGEYVRRKADLAQHLAPTERALLCVPQDGTFDAASAALLAFLKTTLLAYGE